MPQQDHLARILDGISRDIETIRNNQENHASTVNTFMFESSKDRALLRQTVESLQTKVDRLAKVLGVHKKKGLWAMLVATLTGAAIASGTINYQKLLEKIFGFGGHGQ